MPLSPDEERRIRETAASAQALEPQLRQVREAVASIAAQSEQLEQARRVVADFVARSNVIDELSRQAAVPLRAAVADMAGRVAAEQVVRHHVTRSLDAITGRYAEAARRSLEETLRSSPSGQVGQAVAAMAALSNSIMVGITVPTIDLSAIRRLVDDAEVDVDTSVAVAALSPDDRAELGNAVMVSLWALLALIASYAVAGVAAGASAAQLPFSTALTNTIELVGFLVGVTKLLLPPDEPE